jgi:hypothetical protein
MPPIANAVPVPKNFRPNIDKTLKVVRNPCGLENPCSATFLLRYSKLAEFRGFFSPNNQMYFLQCDEMIKSCFAVV